MTSPKTYYTTEEISTLLGITGRSVRRLAQLYNRGTPVNARMILFTAEDLEFLRSKSTGKRGRPKR